MVVPLLAPDGGASRAATSLAPARSPGRFDVDCISTTATTAHATTATAIATFVFTPIATPPTTPPATPAFASEDPPRRRMHARLDQPDAHRRPVPSPLHQLRPQQLEPALQSRAHRLHRHFGPLGDRPGFRFSKKRNRTVVR